MEQKEHDVSIGSDSGGGVGDMRRSRASRLFATRGRPGEPKISQPQLATMNTGFTMMTMRNKH